MLKEVAAAEVSGPATAPPRLMGAGEMGMTCADDGARPVPGPIDREATVS